MNVNIELPLIDGFEYTGEYRSPKVSEYYLGWYDIAVLADYTWTNGEKRFILTKARPRIRPMTAKEIAMLPRGTAFFCKGGNVRYNVDVCENNSGRIYINGADINMYYTGYKLPTDDVIRTFTVEE